MSELKTLKDFKPYYDGEGYLIDYAVKKEELRQEAIKWIKNCDGFIPSINNCGCSGCQRFIKFFNITDEDLK